MKPTQVSKDQYRLKEKIENERIEKEAIGSEERRENEEKEKEVEKTRTKNLFVYGFSSTVCNVILQEQKDRHVKTIHQLPCLKRKLVHSALLCIQSDDEEQSFQTQRMELFVITYEAGVVLARKVLHKLQPLERNKTKFIQVAFDLGGREIISSCGEIKFFTRT